MGEGSTELPLPCAIDPHSDAGSLGLRSPQSVEKLMRPCRGSACLRFVRTWPHFTHLRLNDFRDRYGSLDHFNRGGFDC